MIFLFLLSIYVVAYLTKTSWGLNDLATTGKSQIMNLISFRGLGKRNTKYKTFYILHLLSKGLCSILHRIWDLSSCITANDASRESRDSTQEWMNISQLFCIVSYSDGSNYVWYTMSFQAKKLLQSLMNTFGRLISFHVQKSDVEVYSISNLVNLVMVPSNRC